MSGLYFNEWERYPAAWLRNLYPSATVDERSITDVEAGDLAGFTRSHFFAGIGGWEYALELAGWPADRPVWTGSCPCQPFSAAGRGLGVDDPRHLWPAWFRLIRERRPVTIFGEQVAGAIGHGWLDGVFADLEAQGYTCGAAVLGAHSVGAPHIRQRLYWVADTDGGQRRWLASGQGGERDRATAGWEQGDGGSWGGGEAGRLADADGDGFRSLTQRHGEPEPGQPAQARHNVDGRGPWSDAVLTPCADGKARRIGAGVRPLAHGVSARASKLRAYGNAIVPQLAAEFIGAFLDAERERRQ